MEVVLNEHTKTLHKHETGAIDLHTVCGVTYNLERDKLRKMSTERVDTEHDVTKCGRCFDDGGGY